jgi:hypothetical protein
VGLVARYYDFNRFKALLWCENYFKLPHMEDVAREVEDDERELKFSEVKPRYIKFASSEIQKHKNVALAEEYLRYYFEGKGNSDAEQDVMPLLAVLGQDIIAEIAKEYGLE